MKLKAACGRLSASSPSCAEATAIRSRAGACATLVILLAVAGSIPAQDLRWPRAMRFVVASRGCVHAASRRAWILRLRAGWHFLQPQLAGGVATSAADYGSSSAASGPASRGSRGTGRRGRQIRAAWLEAQARW